MKGTMELTEVLIKIMQIFFILICFLSIYFQVNSFFVTVDANKDARELTDLTEVVISAPGLTNSIGLFSKEKINAAGDISSLYYKPFYLDFGSFGAGPGSDSSPQNKSFIAALNDSGNIMPIKVNLYIGS